VLQGVLVAVVAVMECPHADHVTPAVTGLTEVNSNLQEAPAASGLVGPASVMLRLLLVVVRNLLGSYRVGC
jgi:hypothetical protein